MLHKWEAMMGLPEGSLAHEKEVRKENAYHNHKSGKESKTQRNTPKEVFEGYVDKEIWKDGGH